MAHSNNWGHVPHGRDIDVVQHVCDCQGGFEAFPFPRVEDPQANRREMNESVDHEQLSVGLWRTFQRDGSYSASERVNDSALAKEVIVIRLLGSGVKVFARRVNNKR